MYGRGYFVASCARHVIPGHCLWNFGSPWNVSSD